MKNYEQIILERDREREALNALTGEERKGEAYLARYYAFSEHHKNVVVPIELKMGKPETRIVYAVCGYSERHGYFRNKRAVFDTLKEAKETALKLKDDKKWGIPTLIIQVTFFRSETFGCYDFDNNGPDDLGFSQDQKIVWKHKCGYTALSWEDMLLGPGTDYTY
ncbi:hypothetical protein U6A24_12695 [Aquimarina gracilis]|uniref:Uncharacterized protein n=1 Tax=Aquimarina gracilis TaxID=874422 RepID=A0ABU5ZWS5_9FLAO|nr:hypothetical protein [Aquimarina gracilis]MEB3346328.1 hypothetical protein [Aquimarina gracilis]